MSRVLRRFLYLLFAAVACALLANGIRAQARGDRWYEAAPLGRQYAYDDLIAEASAKHGVDRALLKAIVWHESRFDPTKVHDGGYGLMQIGKGTGMEWAAAHRVESFMVTDLLDARTNLQAGAWYLRQALDHWRDADDPVVFGLAEYVAGPEAIERWTGGSRKEADLRSAMKGTVTESFVNRVLERAGAER